MCDAEVRRWLREFLGDYDTNNTENITLEVGEWKPPAAVLEGTDPYNTIEGKQRKRVWE